MKERFFEEPSDQSQVKARIVQKYFYAWANVVIPTARERGGRIGYVDLFSGPGRYRDGTPSTPLLVIKHAIEHPEMSRMLVSYFNDSDSKNAAILQEELDKLPNIERLTYRPTVKCEVVDEKIAKKLSETRLIPTFSFIDPFGYKGLSRDLIKSVIKDWGCDCVFFFNYNRVNPGIDNEAVREHIDALFGPDRSAVLREELASLRPHLREARILEEMASTIQSLGQEFVLPFTFKNAERSRTSHNLIFVSKHFKGYEIMKEIMAAESSSHDEGVPSLEYSPADATMPLLFSLQQPLQKLRASLLSEFSGKTETFQQIYRLHSVNRRYIKRNYRAVLIDLEQEGRVKIVDKGEKRRKGTFPPHLEIQFP